MVGPTSCSTPHGTKSQTVYAAKLEFPGTPLPAVPTVFVIGSTIKNQGIDVLIGRDYLLDKVLVFNGPQLGYTIHF